VTAACGGATPSPIRDGAPAWSPDGRQVAFYSEVNGQAADLYVINADGTGLRQLTNTPVAEGYPSWSPDGTHIAFESHTPDGNFDIYVMRADGSQVTRLTDHPMRDVGPSWSPDGTRIVFMSDRDGQFHLYRMAAAGGPQEQLTQGASDWFPQFSRDGSTVAFHRWSDVHLLDLASGEIRGLTTAPDDGMYPSWAPDRVHEPAGWGAGRVHDEGRRIGPAAVGADVDGKCRRPPLVARWQVHPFCTRP